MKTSILIATHKRNNVLKWNLHSLTKQHNTDVEIVVLDDCYISDNECKDLASQFNATYIHSGATKQNKDVWRIPGFAFNIGAKQSTSDIIILSCGEMYHIGNTTKFIIDSITTNENLMCSVNGRYDDGTFLANLECPKISDRQAYGHLPKPLRTFYPFFMGVKREHFLNVGGYDESFIGVAADDDDITLRLIRYGLNSSHQWGKGAAIIPIPPNIHIVHLTSEHGAESELDERVVYNRKLLEYNNTNSVIQVNVDKEWGKL